MLYDEVAYRDGADIPAANIREAYQIIKQRCSQMGDHSRAGDFHYGEMEMKRREYGWPWRALCPEILYWALSGYGTGYLRAAFWLLVLLLGLPGWYVWMNPHSFGATWFTGSSWFAAFRYGLAVMTLQRPEVPPFMNSMGYVFQVVQATWGPVQIALLGLALRMRLKR